MRRHSIFFSVSYFLSSSFLSLALAGASLLVLVNTCPAGVIWFDEKPGKHSGFKSLVEDYQEFMGDSSHLITFNDLPERTVLGSQYAKSDGVRFSNTTGGWSDVSSGLHREGESVVQDVTGYDGSYMPDGDMVYVKFDNNRAATPFTIIFDDPISQVGAFVGMGVEGGIHALTITAYDEANRVLGHHKLQAELWEKKSSWQNYESVFGLRAEGTAIHRIEILNESKVDFANGLIFDNLSFSGFSTPVVPDPANSILMMAGMLLLLGLVIRRRAPQSRPCPVPVRRSRCR